MRACRCPETGIERLSGWGSCAELAGGERFGAAIAQAVPALRDGQFQLTACSPNELLNLCHRTLTPGRYVWHSYLGSCVRPRYSLAKALARLLTAPVVPAGYALHRRARRSCQLRT